jgi:hypothetical protein
MGEQRSDQPAGFYHNSMLRRGVDANPLADEIRKSK